ncbi:transposase family protein [Streptomyces hirsutus]|uniref:Transposase family protein n=1 Tax=Streptomyces hirsutus TaxID=35620 RepID=A0ABZ1GEU9_9ACTN|nr:transposase family protein [Streptomyces hirsutus]WSD04490.1 transposase family protein [Streptomyces hirsutus]WTD22119.1 transposase family protein [Streptomyces hirsutus]
MPRRKRPSGCGAWTPTPPGGGDAGPAPGATADAETRRDSGPAGHCQGVTVLGHGAYINTGLVVPHRKRPERPLREAEEEDNAQHRKVRARVEHLVSRMKNRRAPARRFG